MLDDFISLIFPKICAACGNSLLKQENCICLHCLATLPKTNFHLEKENPITKLFWGRTTIYSAASLFQFNQGGRVQKLIHQLKYKSKQEIGFYLGKHYGYLLSAAPLFASADFIVPVPLHSQALKKRGYNQSECLAIGMAEAMRKEMINNVLIRKEVTASQTKKSRFGRWQNVEEVFALNNPEKLIGKHLLLVDDVITTGATIEACSSQLLNIPNTTVSAITIAAALLN